MRNYYQSSYHQEGLTTDLPSDLDLERLMQSNFSGSQKDFSRVVFLLRQLGVSPGASILDYGANWGYGAFQFKRAGYSVKAYEVSKKRAAFGLRIGIKIETGLSKMQDDFDAVYSSHVLEHMSNPLAGLREQFDRVRKGGFLIGHTPNGSLARRSAAFDAFRHHWGMVHPVLLSDRFIATNFADYPFFVSSQEGAESVREWDGKQRTIGNLEGSELLFVIRRQ